VRHKAEHKAFTLIEMLVSLAIVSTIVTMVYGSYAATSRSLEVYSSRMACCERAQLALRLMARQIRCAYAPATAPTVFQAEPQNLRGDLLSFATTSGFGLGLDRPVGISHVAYRYDSRARILSLRCEPGVYRQDSLRDSDTWRPMLTDVASIELKFHDGRNWQPRWDSTHGGRLPQAVKIVLSITDERGRHRHYATTVPVVCQKASQVQQVRKPGRQP